MPVCMCLSARVSCAFYLALCFSVHFLFCFVLFYSSLFAFILFIYLLFLSFKILACFLIRENAKGYGFG